MARIPRADDGALGSRMGVAVAQAPVLSTATPTLNLQDQTALGKTAEMVGAAQERLDNKELSDAEIQFQLGQMAEDEKYDLDDELETIEDRHGGGLTEQLGKAAANITNANVRSLFVQKGQVAVEKSKFVMAEKVFKRKADRERGFMANAFTQIVKGATNLEYGNVQDGVIAMQLATESMVERGVMTQEEAQAVVRQGQHDMALGRLRAMDPERQLLALQEEWTKFLPEDVLKKVRDDAELLAADQAAHTQALGMQDMTYEEGIAFLQEKYADDVLAYDKAKTRFQAVKNDQEIMTQDAQKVFYEDHYASVFWGDTKINDLREQIDNADLSDAQLNNLRMAEENAIKRAAGEKVREFSDPVVEAELVRLISQGRETEARKYWSENYAKLSKADFRYYDSRLSPSKNSAEEFKPIRSARQLMKEFKDNGHSMTGKQETKIWDRIRELSENYYANNNGKNPEKAMVNEWLRTEFAEVVMTREDDRVGFMGYLFGDEEYTAYDIPLEQRKTYDTITNVLMGATGTLDPEKARIRFNKIPEKKRLRIISIRETNPEMSDAAVLREAYKNPDEPAGAPITMEEDPQVTALKARFAQ